jgi:hypothetical protein
MGRRLDAAWANPQVNVVTIVAWAGVGKSTLLNHWLGRMAAERYRSAQLVFGWSFYRRGSSGGTSSADEFLDAALAWFGDPDPRIGTAWEKGERLAKLIAHRRTLRLWSADLHRLRGVLLTATGADETQIEASFCEAIRTAREQKSIPMARRAEASYAEYRRQKASGSGEHGFRLPLW